MLKLFLLFDFGFWIWGLGWPESHRVAQAGIELPGDSPASAKSRDSSHVLFYSETEDAVEEKVQKGCPCSDAVKVMGTQYY